MCAYCLLHEESGKLCGTNPYCEENRMRIDVFHDIACPWCRIGKANLARALQDWEGDPVTVHYHPFFLNPNIPEEGANFREYMLAKGGHRIPLEGFFAGPREAGLKAGLTFNFEQIEVAPNTLHAHRLVELTPAAMQPQMIDALYTAYFEEARDVGDQGVLADIAAEQGLDRAQTLQRLASDEARDVVWGKVQQAQQLGISGVPFFVFNNRLAASGAQPPDVLLQVLVQSQGEIPIR